MGLALGAALAIPPAGTESRSRDFCRQWLELSPSQKQDLLVADEPALTDPASEGACCERLRPALRHKPDAECRNWSLLMGFEVRSIVDTVTEPCTETRSGDATR